MKHFGNVRQSFDLINIHRKTSGNKRDFINPFDSLMSMPLDKMVLKKQISMGNIGQNYMLINDNYSPDWDIELNKNSIIEPNEITSGGKVLHHDNILEITHERTLTPEKNQIQNKKSLISHNIAKPEFYNMEGVSKKIKKKSLIRSAPQVNKNDSLKSKLKREKKNNHFDFQNLKKSDLRKTEEKKNSKFNSIDKDKLIKSFQESLKNNKNKNVKPIIKGMKTKKSYQNIQNILEREIGGNIEFTGKDTDKIKRGSTRGNGRKLNFKKSLKSIIKLPKDPNSKINFLSLLSEMKITYRIKLDKSVCLII